MVDDAILAPCEYIQGFWLLPISWLHRKGPNEAMHTLCEGERSLKKAKHKVKTPLLILLLSNQKHFNSAHSLLVGPESSFRDDSFYLLIWFP